jgi:hypothetical protein
MQESTAVQGAVELAGGRYRIDAVLGRGGMGTVYAVTDVTSGGTLALKRPRAESVRAPSSEQFHREYQLLAELSHPSIIRVFDYGLDAHGAYYTMELLSGPSLADQGVLDWRRACELVRDVASSLAVVHARRLVHRDVTLRNIHYDGGQGRCKLLDFGAVMSSGVAASIVGTPPYLPPEALQDAPLDARADLFALGACLYCMLTGRHAYPALRTEELPAMWKERPQPPQVLNARVPAALSQLTMALLSLDPLARPNTAAEVMDRLSALAGLEVREPPAVRRAYLTTPALVGRARALQQVRAFTARGAVEGGVLVITGPTGIGRSRIVDACATHARLSGMHVAQVRARDAQSDYALAHALVSATVQAMPEAGNHPQARLLLRLLRGAAEPVAPGDGPGSHREQLRRDAQRAMCGLYEALSSSRPLLLAIDDMDRADEPSAALLVALFEATRGRALRLVVSAASDRVAHAADAIGWLEQAGARVVLANLTSEQVFELLMSVFGDGPNVRLLADRIYAISGGHPQWIMQLAEHLCEHGLVRYEAGAFIVPAQLALHDVPRTLHDALLARLARLGEGARTLVQAYMLEPDVWYSAPELVAISALADGEIGLALDELLQAGVLACEHQRFGLCHHAIAVALRRRASKATRQLWHGRLARMFEQRGDAPRAAQHSWAAGDREAAVTLLAGWAHALSRGLSTDASLLDREIAGMPAGFLGTLSDAVAACIELGRSRHDELILRCACVHVGATTFDGGEVPHLAAVLARLRVDAGLDAWDRLAHVTDPRARLNQALRETEARHLRLPERERTFPVAEAIRLLAVMVAHGTAVCTQGRDLQLAYALPSLAPLAPLSPSLVAIDRLVETVRHLMSGRVQTALAGYHEILALLEGPAGATIDATARRYIKLAIWYTLGMIAGERGQVEALVWADKLDSELMFEVGAWRVRMCFHRVRGDAEEAERCRRHAELLRIQHRPHQHLGRSQLDSDLLYCLSSEDLMSVKRLAQELEPVAQRFAGWRPVLALVRAEYQRLRGDLHAALALYEQARTLRAAEDGPWGKAMGGQLGCMYALGRVEETRKLGYEWLRELAAAGLGEQAGGIVTWVAISAATLGHAGEAVALADGVVRDIEAMELTGIHAGVIYEVRARIAALLGDAENFERYRARCAAEFKRGRAPALWARYERLLRDARARGIGMQQVADATGGHGGSPAWERHAGAEGDVELDLGDRAALRAQLDGCGTPELRAASLLELLARRCDASGGLLYVADDGTMTLRAIYGTAQAGELQTHVQALHAPATTVVDAEPGACTLPLLEVTREPSPHVADARYRSFLLTDDSTGETLLVGMTLLKPAYDRTAAPPAELLRFVTSTLLEFGDAHPMPLR